MLHNVIIGTIPAAIVGFFLKDQIDAYLFNIDNIGYLSFSYLFLSGILFFTKNNISNNRNDILLKYAFIICLAQCFAIIPGILILFAQEYFCLYPSNLFLYPIIFILPVVLF